MVVRHDRRNFFRVFFFARFTVTALPFALHVNAAALNPESVISTVTGCVIATFAFGARFFTVTTTRPLSTVHGTAELTVGDVVAADAVTAGVTAIIVAVTLTATAPARQERKKLFIPS